MEILLIEDDVAIGKPVHQGLTESGHVSRWVTDGKKGLEEAESQRFDVIILDLLLPELPGLEVLEKIRKAGIGTPILILTALGSVEDRVTGLKNGADDYLVKPFAMPELLARIEALRRRTGARPSPTIHAGPLHLDLSTRRVSLDGADIEQLTPTEFSILEMLMRHSGQVVTRKMICEALWESDWEGTTNVIEVHINRLRGKLQRVAPEPLIHTVRGRGYALRAT